MNIYESTYKEIPSIKIENDLLCITVLPSQGSKISSLIFKPTGKEFVLQSGYTKYPEAHYGQDYLHGDCSGVDEMFPNIDPFFYETEPWAGAQLPDHGEVWALPWAYTYFDDAIEFSVHGIRLPYALKKRIAFSKSDTLHISYTLYNLSPYKMDYIWAAHMMLNGERNCLFRFPDGLEKAYCTMSDSRRIGGYGDTFTYPHIKQADGSMYDIRVHTGREANDYQKFYFADKLTEGWGEIIYPDGHRLRIEFPEEQVPYLGAVQGEGGSLGIHCMFLEPCTGAFDRPDIAKLHGMNSIIEGGGEVQWYLNISIAKETR